MDYLIRSRGFTLIAIDRASPPSTDFWATVEGLDRNGGKVRIALLAGTDSRAKMSRAANHCRRNGPHNFYVSSIRDDYSPTIHPNDRDHFNAILGGIVGTALAEIPLGKVRGGANRPAALHWYETALDALSRGFLP
jgi:hypothetical protein